MHMPGFTAEVVLGPSARKYIGKATSRSFGMDTVLPQYDCNDELCRCHGDYDCNIMFSSGQCGLSQCYTDVDGNVTCFCYRVA